MRSIKYMVVCSIVIAGLLIAGCKKESYMSRDTSGLIAPPPPDTTAPPVVDNSIVFENADKTDGWQVANGDPVLVKTGQKEGAGYIQGTIPAGGDFMQFIKTVNPPVDTKLTLNNGELIFWFYIPDVSLVTTDGQIQFSSSGAPDNNRVGWGFDKILPTLKTGWNHLQLRFKDASLTGDGGPDFSAMNFIKIFFHQTNSTSAQNYGVDDFRVDVAPAPAPVVFDNADKTDGWQVANGDPVLVKVGQKEGAGYIQGTIPAEGDFMQFIKTITPPIDTKVTMETGKLSFWLYVPDASLVNTDGQIQFSSSGAPDDFRVGWSFGLVKPSLKNGWNHLELKFSESDGITGDGGPKLNAMNFIKIFFHQEKSNSPQNYGVDDFKVVEVQ
nr:hypothetical protein [Mucilaginibacter sp. L294]